MPKRRAKEEAEQRKESQQRLFKLPSEVRQLNSFELKKRSDARKHDRFKPKEAKIRVAKHGLFSKIGIAKNVGSNILDLSEGGARIRVSSMLKKGTKVYLRLDLPKFRDTVDAEGEVRWVRRTKNEDEYEIGIMFTNIEDKHKNKINFMRRYFDSKES